MTNVVSNYRYRQSKGGNVSIEETKTDQVVYEALDNKDTRAIYRNLKHGGGFNGWTPTFFMKRGKALDEQEPDDKGD